MTRSHNISEMDREMRGLKKTESTYIRGALLCPNSKERSWLYHPDSIVHINQEGQINAITQAQEWYKSGGDQGGGGQGEADPLPIPPITHPGKIWMPGFVDTHVHYPQTAIIGSASGPLLRWLERSVFPEESKFQDLEYAELIAERFCEHLLSQGTTSAAIYSSSHRGSTDTLFRVMTQRGLRGDVGMTLMDRGAPEALINPVSRAMEECEWLIERWHQSDDDRLRFCVTPRFGLSCTPQLLRGAGDLSEKYSLLTQTHISENPQELTATAEAFPSSTDYLAVYEDHGLLNNRSLFAHCIWLSESEWSRLSEADASITHCPDSNFFLGSGQMCLQSVIDRGVAMGLGSDIGAGRSFSLRKACARAYDASRISQSVVQPEELLWWATRGGAIAMGRADQVGCLEVGYEADMIAIDLPPHFELSASLSEAEVISALSAQLIFCEDWNGVVDVRVRGESIWSQKK